MCFMLGLGEVSSAQPKFCDRYATTRFAGANTCANSPCQLVVRLRLSSAATKLLVRAGSCHSDCCNEPLTASVWSSRRATATLLTASEISFCCSPKSTSGVRTDDQSAARPCRVLLGRSSERPRCCSAAAWQQQGHRQS